MPYSPLRLLALAIASIMTLSVAAPADAAKKKTQRQSAPQSRAAKPRTTPRPAPRRPAAVPLPIKQDNAAKLNRIYDEYWDASMRLNPLQATFQGDPRYNDQLPNFLSAASRQQSHDFMVEWLGKAEAVGIDRGPGGTQPNSYTDLTAWGVGGSYITDKGYIGASYKDTDSEYGTVAEENVFIKLNQERYDVRGEYRFDDGPFSALRGSYGHAEYTHTEFEDVGEPGTIFNSDGWEGRADLVQRERNGWNGAVGLQGLSRNFQAIGEEAFVPTVDIDELGVYTVQRLDRAHYGFEGGLRYDRRELSATPIGGVSQVNREFNNWSASVAGFLRPAPGLFLGLSLAHNERAPSEVELFADGVHIATAAYETGDLNLNSEKVNTLEGTVHYDRGRFTGDLHIYHSWYNGFIDERATGADYLYEGEEFPIFQFVQTDARFYGFELEGAYALWESGDRKLSLEGAADFVHAQTDLGPAARIPPYSVTGRLAWTSTPFDASVEVRHVGEQDRVANAYELPTDDYTLLNLAAAWRPLTDHNVTIFAEARNLTNEEAREHVSFLKDIAPMAGRNLRVGVAYRF